MNPTQALRTACEDLKAVSGHMQAGLATALAEFEGAAAGPSAGKRGK